MKYIICLFSLMSLSLSLANAQETSPSQKGAELTSTEVTNDEPKVADINDISVADNNTNVITEPVFNGVPLEDYSFPIRSFTAEEIDAVPYPNMEFVETEGDVKDYDKYFYFHRENTSFEDAFADISECDDLAVGVSRYRTSHIYSPNLVGAAIGNVLGNLLVDALFAGPERKRTRRVSIRNCMGFKGYNRYGTNKDIYKGFEYLEKTKVDTTRLSQAAKIEARKKAKEDKRESILLSQAKIASGPKPTAEVLPK